MAELHEVDAWLAALISQLEPAARKKMLHQVAREVRRIQQARMTEQLAPDGSTWEPRRITARTKPDRIKRKMFVKLKTTKYLKIKATSDNAEVAFVHAVQRLARVHHYGLRERAGNRTMIIKYPSRRLLGIDNETIIIIEGIMLEALQMPQD
ncbi:phage virion morphogenesis protein [Pantoea agglomerans]|uniref:phage virion morphogenesis protein n=1 Tax=Enterobacter agglomerans TaxID=549 RepID=UPI002783077D|nr:phage virion morphogenesis protein [Pantoea agglomerans]MDQ0433496.1 phage virion morphogenesis protein [Pantoea agglomerans]